MRRKGQKSAKNSLKTLKFSDLHLQRINNYI